jgi:hypothetical protein
MSVMHTKKSLSRKTQPEENFMRPDFTHPALLQEFDEQNQSVQQTQDIEVIIIPTTNLLLG